jgi:hypothetical protein
MWNSNTTGAGKVAELLIIIAVAKSTMEGFQAKYAL